MTWHELHLKPGVTPGEVYAKLDLNGHQFHHFWDEPWNPGAYILRFHVDDVSSRDVRQLISDDRVHVIDMTEDEEYYGDRWPAVTDFFRVSSQLAPGMNERLRMKLVHCFLNAQGLDPWDEAKFALRFFWNRATIRWRRRGKS